MSDIITVTGIVGTDPKHVTTNAGLAITSFRLASAHRRFDRATQSWIDVNTNWYSVTAFRQLAMNTAASIRKGDRIIVTGRLTVKQWESNERSGTSIELEAETLGPDLAWGTAQYVKSLASVAAGAAAQTHGGASRPDGGAEVERPLATPGEWADGSGPSLSDRVEAEGGSASLDSSAVATPF